MRSLFFLTVPITVVLLFILNGAFFLMYKDVPAMEEFIVYGEEEEEFASKNYSDDYWINYEENREKIYRYFLDDNNLFRHLPDREHIPEEKFVSKEEFMTYGVGINNTLLDVSFDQDKLYFIEMNPVGACLPGIYNVNVDSKEISKIPKLESFNFCPDGKGTSGLGNGFAYNLVFTEIYAGSGRLNKIQIYNFELDKIVKNIVLEEGVFFGSLSDDSCPLPDSGMFFSLKNLYINTYVDCDEGKKVRREVIL